MSVPEASRRIGAAWLLFEDLEPKAGDDLGAMWGSISAVYPEMQDWVARRGHGGAALWDPVASAAEVAALKADDHLVVLQLHAGYEFQDSPSDNVRAIAREAIDAGADIVIGHHPHVLQGLEIYKGRLIAYSMGNFIFDQDFLATLASGFLRTVWDGDTLLEARLVPLEISDYRPLPVVGAAARQNLFRVWERSLLGGGASKDELGLVHTFPITLDADTVPAQLIVEHNTARLVATPPAPMTVELTVPAHGMVPLPFDGLVAARLGRAPAASDTVWVGKDLFGWGRFEDETADGRQSGATHWNLDTCREIAAHGGGATGDGFLRLMRDQTENAITRPVVRVSLPRHMAWEHGPGGSLPLDPEPSYSLHAQARVSGPGEVFARVAVYYFDNKNPTEDAATVLLKEIERPIVIAHDGEWHEVELPFTTEELDGEDHEANAVMLYFFIDYPGIDDVTTLDVDDVAFIEWREAAAMPDRFGDYDWVRNDGDDAVELRAPGLGATTPGLIALP